MGILSENKELSEREREVIEQLAKGLSNKEIASQLTVSVNTIKVHVRNIFAKLDVQTRTEAVMIAIREGWVIVPQLNDERPAEETSQTPTIVDVTLPLWRRIALVTVVFIAFAGFFVSDRQPTNGVVTTNDPFTNRPIPVGISLPTNGESLWEVQTPMPSARTLFAVAAYQNRVVAIGGDTIDGVTGSVEWFESGENTWTEGAAKPTSVSQIAAVTIGDNIVVPGGMTASGMPTTTVEIYNVTNDSWSHAAALLDARVAYALAAFENDVYLFGGGDGSTYSSNAYVYDLESDQWNRLPSMHTPRGYTAAAVLGDAIYVVGGYDGQVELSVCERYLPHERRWETCPSMSVGRGGLALVNLAAGLYAIGGGGWTGYLAFNEVLTENSDSWRTIPTPLTEQWRGLGAAVIASDIIALGGWNGQYLAITERYSPFGFKLFVPSALDAGSP